MSEVAIGRVTQLGQGKYPAHMRVETISVGSALQSEGADEEYQEFLRWKAAQRDR